MVRVTVTLLLLLALCALPAHSQVTQIPQATGGPGSGMPDPGSNGFMVRTALNTDVARTFGASCGLTATNADGTGGNTSYTGSSPVSLKTAGYTVADGDCGALLSFSSGSSIAVTLPQAGASSLFASGWYACFGNRGVGAVTITPTTSSIDGHATLALTDGSTTTHGACIHSDGTNYFTYGIAGGGSAGGGVSIGTAFQLGNGSGGFSAGNLGQNADGTVLPTNSIGYAVPTACTLVSTTRTCDGSVSNIWMFTITGDWTLDIANMHPGFYWLIVTQDGTGGRILTLPAAFLNGSSLSPIAGVTTAQGCLYDGTHFDCLPASSTETAGIFRLPERTAPIAAPGSGKMACWADSGNHTLNCYDGTSTAVTYTVPQATTATANQWFRSLNADGSFGKSQPAFTDISGTASGAQLPNPSVSTLGGIQSKICTAGDFVSTISTSGVPTCTTPSAGGVVLNTAGIGWLAPITDCAYCQPGSTEAANVMEFVQIVPKGSINLKKVSVVWSKANGAGNTYAGIYSDVAGTCTTLLGQTTATSNNVVTGTKLELTFSSTVNLTSNTTYWLALGSDVTQSLYESGNSGVGNSMATALQETGHARFGIVTGALSSGVMPSSCPALTTTTAHIFLAIFLP